MPISYGCDHGTRLFYTPVHSNSSNVLTGNRSMTSREKASLLVVVAMSGSTYFPSDCLASKYSVVWSDQFGDEGLDRATSVAAGLDGAVYVTGFTDGAIVGENQGSYDGFLRRYDAEGKLSWTRQFGSTMFDSGNAVAVDATGNAFLAGRSDISRGGSNSTRKATIDKFDESGRNLWSRQIGGTSSVSYSISDIASDNSGGAVVSGIMGLPTDGDVQSFVANYDRLGMLKWITQFGTSSNDYATAIAVDNNGDVLVSGITYGDLGGGYEGEGDAFLGRFNGEGEPMWLTNHGTTAHDRADAITISVSGDIYITGRTSGDLGGENRGLHDGYVSKFSRSGEPIWSSQYGTMYWDNSLDIVSDIRGKIVVVGYTDEVIFGRPDGDKQAIITQFSPDGLLVSSQGFGAQSDYDFGVSIAAAHAEQVFLAGYTDGSLAAPNLGGQDGFLLLLAVPEPSSTALSTVVVVWCVWAPLLKRS